MRIIPIVPFLSGIASAMAAAEAAFSAAISRQPPPSRSAIPTGGTAPAVFVPEIIVPPVQIKAAETEPVQPFRFAPVKLDFGPAEPAAPPDLSEPIRKSIFEDGVSVEKAAKDNGMTEQQVLDMLDNAQGVTVTPGQSDAGKQFVIADQRSGQTITIIHDDEKGTDSVTIEGPNGKRSSWFADGNGVTTHTTYNPETGVTKSHSVDPRTGTVTDSTTPKDGPTRIVITDAAGNKTIKIVGDDYTSTTGPDGKVTVTDNATGVSIALEKLTYAEALRLDKKLADDIGTAETARNAAQKKMTDAGMTPEMLSKPDPSKFTAEQAKLYKEYLQAQAGLNKLLVERRILVAQFKVSLAEPGTKEHTQAINELLNEANLQQQVIEYDNAKINLADKMVGLIEADGNASKYELFDDALAAFRAIPNNEDYFNRDGFMNGHNEHTGKLLKQEVIFKDGQIYLRNTYENHIWDGSNVLDKPLTFDPDRDQYRTDEQREIDIKWDGQKGPFTRDLCVSVDTGWNAARTRQSQASSDYLGAKNDLDRTQQAQVEATIPDLQKIYNDAVKKHGGPTKDKPTGQPDGGGEWVQIQKDGQLLWAHPEVAAAYLALRSAQEDSAALEARIRQTDKSLQWTNIQRANPGAFLDGVSPGYQDDLWSRNSDLMIQTDRNVNAAQTEHLNIQNDRVQTQIGIENANEAAWRRAHPELAARLDALEKGAPTDPSKLPAGTELVRPKHLENFIGPVAVDQLVRANPTLAQVSTILHSKEGQPLLAARQRIEELEGEQTEIKDLQGHLKIDRKWLNELEAMPEDERRDKGKRDDRHLDFVGDHAQEFSDPAQALQKQLGGPVTGRDASIVRPMVEKMAADMKKQGMDVDVEHVVTQILRSPQINGDHPDQAGDLTIKPIAMVYKESGFSTTTGVFEVTNRQGKTFVVDLKGNIWSDRDEFLDENKLYSDKGILLMPKEFDTSGGADGVIDYEAKTARNKDFFERWLDPAIGVVTAIATVASFIPGVNVVAAPIAIAGGVYLGSRAVVNQYQHVRHGGSWTDGESGMNMLSIATAAAPMASSGLRMFGLARNSVRLRSAARFSIGAAPRSAPYFERAGYLTQASVIGGQGLRSMRLARVFDGTALATGAPLVVMSTRDLAHLDQMSGIDKANAILNFATGWFGSGMGYMGLRASRPGRFDSIRPEDAPEVMPTDSQSGGRKWRLFSRRGDDASSEPEVFSVGEIETSSPAYVRNPSVLRARLPDAVKTGSTSTPDRQQPTTVFRGDTRSPDVIFTNGFGEQGQPDPYGRISVSLSARDARDFAAGVEGGWVYTIISNVSDGEVVGSLPYKGRDYTHENALDAYEVAMRGEVRPEDILAARPTDMEGNYIGAPVYNRNFKDSSMLPDSYRGVIRLIDENGQRVDAQIRGVPPQSADKVYVPPEGDGRSPALEDGTPAWAVDPELMGKTHIFVRDPESGEASVLPWARGASIDDVGDGGPIHPALGVTARDVRATPPLTDAEIAANHQEATGILDRLTGGLSVLNGIEALAVHDLADQASRSPILMELLRIADRKGVRITDGSSNPLQIEPRSHQMNDVQYSRGTNVISLQSADPYFKAHLFDAGPEFVAAELTVQLAHELAHASGWRRDQGMDVPQGLSGREAFETGYVNMRLEDEGHARLVPIAVADELVSNGGYVAPSLHLDEAEPYVALFHRFKSGEITWAEAVREASVLVRDNPNFTYRQEFEASAARIWENSTPIRQLYERTPPARTDAPEGDGPDLMADGQGPQPPTPSQLHGMSDGDVGSMSLADIILFTEDHVAALTNRHWIALSNDQVAAIPEGAMPGLRPGRLARLSPEKAAAFTDGQLAAMTKPQARKLALDQIDAFSPDQIRVIMDNHVTVLRPAQIGRLSQDQMTGVSADHVAQLSEAQIQGLTKIQLTRLTGDQMATFTADRIVWLKAEQIGALTPDQVRAFSEEQLKALTPAQIGRLTEGQLTALSRDQVRSLTRQQITALRPEQVAMLTPDQIKALSKDQVAGLRPEQIGGLTADQLATFTGKRLELLTGRQLSGLRADQIPTLTLGQMRDLTPAQISGLRAEQIPMFSVEQLRALSEKQVQALTQAQIGKLSDEQLAIFTGTRMRYLTADQLGGLRPEQIAQLTPEQIAAMPVESLAGLSAAQLASFSVAQLHAFTDRQVKALTPEQRAQLSADQTAALDAPGVKGVRRRWNGLITEIRENGKSYLVLSGVSLVNGFIMHKTGALRPLSDLAFMVRGGGFMLQSLMPNKFGANTDWGPRFAKIYAATFIPNVADGTIKMFTPDENAPGVYVPFGIGTIPFAAQQTHYAINDSAPTAHRGNHVGYLGYTVGSGFYIPDSYGPSAIGDWAGPASAYMFMGGSTLWLGAWVDARRAARDTPGTGRTWGEQKVDAVVLDGKTPIGKLIRGYENHRDGIDRFATGGLYGGGLILFGAMGMAQTVKNLLEDEPKQGVDAPTSPPTQPSQQPDDPTTPEPPDKPEKPEQPDEPEPTEPPFVIVEQWRPDGSPADNSTLWHVAGNNLRTLLTSQQMDRVESGDFSLQDDRDTLVADWAMPRLVALNPQYPLRENPDLIQPGWRLRVG